MLFPRGIAALAPPVNPGEAKSLDWLFVRFIPGFSLFFLRRCMARVARGKTELQSAVSLFDIQETTQRCLRVLGVFGSFLVLLTSSYALTFFSGACAPESSFQASVHVGKCKRAEAASPAVSPCAGFLVSLSSLESSSPQKYCSSKSLPISWRSSSASSLSMAS